MLKKVSISTLARFGFGIAACASFIGAARADVSSTNAAAILVYPKISVNTQSSAAPNSPPYLTDTLIQLTNTGTTPVNVRCWYVNANGHCSTSPTTICRPNGDPATDPCSSLGGVCQAACDEHDFAFRLTPKQTIAWEAGAGLSNLPLADRPGPGGQFNTGSIPPAPEDPMLGELKCLQVDDAEAPVAANSLIGMATIGSGPGNGAFDQRSYNALGIKATQTNNQDGTLTIGGDNPEYNACPGSLSLDHFFDNATEPVNGDSVHTRLILVPCSEDFTFQTSVFTHVQYLVWNEFEQRFSTSNPLSCLSDLPLVDIDTRPGAAGDATSIFSVSVQGTLAGQTVIRAVDDRSPDHGNGLLAIGEEYHVGAQTFSAAFVADQRGSRADADVILVPAAGPTGP